MTDLESTFVHAHKLFKKGALHFAAFAINHLQIQKLSFAFGIAPRFDLPLFDDPHPYSPIAFHHWLQVHKIRLAAFSVNNLVVFNIMMQLDNFQRNSNAFSLLTTASLLFQNELIRHFLRVPDFVVQILVDDFNWLGQYDDGLVDAFVRHVFYY
jgi:hypothetical protein